MPVNRSGPYLVRCPTSNAGNEELVSWSGNRLAHGAWASAFRMACGLDADGDYTKVMLPMRRHSSRARPPIEVRPGGCEDSVARGHQCCNLTSC